MMTDQRHSGGSRVLWAYGYLLAPAVDRERLGGLQAILDAGHAEARDRAEVWEGRFINGSRITHILVVSGSPVQDADINRRLEAELERLDAQFSVSVSLEVGREGRRRSGA